MVANRKNLGELLLEYQLVTQNDLENALGIQKKEGGRIGEILVKTGKVTEDDIQYLLSKQLNIPYVILEGIEPDKSLIKKFDHDFLVNNRILPIYETSDKIFIATDDPFNESAFGVLREITAKKIDISAASSLGIKKILCGADKISPNFDLFMGEILERLMESPLYRLDFLYENETLTVSGFGHGVLKELGHINYNNFDYKEVLDYFENKYLGIFYEVVENSKGFFMQSYPVIKLCEDEVVGRFGYFNIKGIVFSDMKYHGKLKVFKHKKSIRGYRFLSFNKFIPEDNVVNIWDNLPEEIRKTANVTVCGKCSGKGCDFCKNLGIAFEGEHHG